jgi:hypothetical protein
VTAPLSTERYEIRFTASASTREKLRRAQDLLRHAVPSGDIAEIFDRALTCPSSHGPRRHHVAVHVAVPVRLEGRPRPAYAVTAAAAGW